MTGLKPYQWDIGGKAFSQNSHIAQHKKVQKVLKPYRCDMCEKIFYSEG